MRPLHAACFAALLWTTAPTALPAQCGPIWVPVHDFEPARIDSLAAMPNGRDVVAALGQSFSSGYTMVDVVHWDGVAWQNLQPGFFPRANRAGSVAVDASGQILAENGGVWLWTGRSWVDTTPGGAPAGSSVSTRMRQMPNGDIVFFRQSTNGTTPNVTYTFEGWHWVGGIWTRVHNDTSPRGVEMILLLPDGSVLVHDRATGNLQRRSSAGTATIPHPSSSTLGYFFSYRPSTGNLLACTGNATWGGVFEWHGTSWQAIGTTTNRAVVGVVEDTLGNLWAYGFGVAWSGQYVSRWNGTSWVDAGARVDVTPSAHATSPNGDLYLLGHFTTHASPVAERSPGIVRRAASVCPPSLASLGSGCVGSSPTLQVVSQAYLGHTFSSRCSTVSNQSIAFWLLNVNSASTRLANLHPAGQVGCFLLAGLDQVALLTLPAAGTVTGQTVLPADPQLLSVLLHNQVIGLEVDAAGSLTRIYSSNKLVTSPSSF